MTGRGRCALLFLLLGAAGVYGQEFSYSGFIGVNFFNYERTMLNTGAALLVALQPDVELDLAAQFCIATRGTERPDIVVPLDGGVNFIFDWNPALLLVGIGLTCAFEFSEDTRVFLGPYLKIGARFSVHPAMRLFVEAQQNLLFGPPRWVNAGTSVLGGLNFSL